MTRPHNQSENETHLPRKLYGVTFRQSKETSMPRRGSFEQMISVDSPYDTSIAKFLTERVGSGCWGLRINDGQVRINVLPMWEKRIREVLDIGGYTYDVEPAKKKTGITVITIKSRVSRKPQQAVRPRSLSDRNFVPIRRVV